MSRAVACGFFWPSQIVLLVLVLISSLSLMTLRRVNANPLPDLTQEYQNLIAESSTVNSTDNSTDNSTETAANTDVYVIKAVVYEIGILTDTDNTTTSESTERHERVDISLYDPPHQKDEFS
ncbi:hypothetical protein ACS0PU_000595 [Formica fusca]|uniref:uncharacterized protein LOC115235980 n=1 Tax=Formica exsecta TaxID=72781 RepID=UPI0011436097|nr:uncharacterized protein LOC115235980 [Formica exsecta]XP_029664014.1 uncharacterized protein LOC115235980 [Formica exsecta]XP_029664015.1 uncharacterized protein LOC115235980 [Formica exsecta]